jgi:hypothetical protein
MPDLKLTCDNCGSMFALSFEDEEVSYAPSHCPFCGDFYDNENVELNFNDDDEDDKFESLEDDFDSSDEDDRRWN